MRFEGGPNRRSGSGSHRTNLPHGVETDTDYREVRVLYTIAAKLDAAVADEEHEEHEEYEEEAARQDEGPEDTGAGAS